MGGGTGTGTEMGGDSYEGLPDEEGTPTAEGPDKVVQRSFLTQINRLELMLTFL
jgi:hypothetical protein